MKNMRLIFSFLLSLVCGVLLVTSCEKEGDGVVAEIGGSANLAENEVGYTADGSIKVNNSSISSAQLKVVESKNGIIAVDCSIPVPAAYSTKLDQIGYAFAGEDYTKSKSTHFDSQGNYKCTLKIKNTSEGVAYVNSLGKQCVVMKYDATVGDSWTYTKKNGKVTEFKVTHKSTAEDYDYIFWKIKVVKVEQTLNEPGLSKIIYVGNHKYGLVAIELRLDDGMVINATKI